MILIIIMWRMNLPESRGRPVALAPGYSKSVGQSWGCFTSWGNLRAARPCDHVTILPRKHMHVLAWKSERMHFSLAPSRRGCGRIWHEPIDPATRVASRGLARNHDHRRRPRDATVTQRAVGCECRTFAEPGHALHSCPSATRSHRAGYIRTGKNVFTPG